MVSTPADLNLEEKIIDHSIRLIWVFYFTGLLYISGSAVGWILALVLFSRFMDGQSLKLHWLAYLWVIGMVIQLLVISVGHINHELPISSLIKSSIGWAKGWALLGLFPVVASLNIRPEVVSQALIRLGQQTLFITPVLIIAAFIHFPGSLYSSPLKFLANPSFFEIELYGLNASTGLPRWRLFTPWGPALGLYGNLLFAFSCYQTKSSYRYIGFVAAIIMVLLSQSRMGLICLLFIPSFCYLIIYLKNLKYLIILALLSPLIAAFIPHIFDTSQDLMQQVHSARADSSRVRGALERIAIERWQEEAPIWGHGVVEKGSHYVEYMPIGSHHTWLGLLFVKGLVGLFAMAIPFFITILWVCVKYFLSNSSGTSFRMYRTSMHLLLILCAYSFTENLEILAYLHWPALLFIGLTIKFSQQKYNMLNQ